jgi:hypothetical protein
MVLNFWYWSALKLSFQLKCQALYLKMEPASISRWKTKRIWIICFVQRMFSLETTRILYEAFPQLFLVIILSGPLCIREIIVIVDKIYFEVLKDLNNLGTAFHEIVFSGMQLVCIYVCMSVWVCVCMYVYAPESLNGFYSYSNINLISWINNSRRK